MAIVLMSAEFTTSNYDQSSTVSTAGDYQFDKEGNLIRPEGYRKWIYIGTPITPNDLNPPEAAFPEFHNVYIHPKDFDHWEKTGKFSRWNHYYKRISQSWFYKSSQREWILYG